MKKTNAIEVKNLVKTYGDVYALKNVDLNISDGEYFVLLGPSGGGKTTLLRSIGGFIRPDIGSVAIKGKNVNDLPPDKRPTSMVFQGFALFPHMNVSQNIGYGLKLQSIDKNIIEDKVNKMMNLVGLTNLHNRMPHELSGGQQQRVQLARALILENDVLLLDEPLSALDAQLRKDMCIELKRLQKTVGISFVHVTHNQEEAMTVADRIAIIANGEVIEEGTPKEIYDKPKKLFTAQFIGEKNILNAKIIEKKSNYCNLNIENESFKLKKSLFAKNKSTFFISFKAENVHLLKSVDIKTKNDCLFFTGKLIEEVYLGQLYRYLIKLKNGKEIQIRKQEEIKNLKLNSEVFMKIDLSNCILHDD